MIEYSYSTVTKKHIVTIGNERKVCDSVEEAMAYVQEKIKERNNEIQTVQRP